MSESKEQIWFRACFTCCAVDPLEGPSLFLCTHCKKVSYCSEECQKIHWELRHEAECKAIYCNGNTTLKYNSTRGQTMTSIVLMDESGITGKGAYIKPYSSKFARIYEGEVLTQQSPQETLLRHGQGRFTDGDRSVYDGTWNKDRRDGFGECIMQNGNRYKGAYKDDYMTGEGVMEYYTGFIYTGEWERDLMHGQGKMINPLGELAYEGEYDRDEPKGGYNIFTDKRNPYQLDSDMARAIAARDADATSSW